MTWRWERRPPPFFDPAEVEAAMMRGSVEVVLH